MAGANQFGIDVGQIVGARNAFADQQQRQQINALALQKGQMDLENAPELNALALKSKQLEVSGAGQAQKLAAHNAEVKLVTDTLGALDTVPDEQLPQATAAAKAALVAQGAGTAALDQAVRESAGDPIKLRAALKMQAQAGLGYAAQLAQKNADRTFGETVRGNKAREDQTAATSAATASRAAATQAQAAAALAETKRHNQAAEGTAALTASQNTGKLTDEQAKAGGFADRASEGDAILGDPKVMDAGMSYWQHVKASTPGGVGNYMVTDEYQKYDQAARNFINAQLRRDSGAAISEGEWDNARKQYLPQPGDSKSVLSQKANNRQTAIGSLGRAAGKGYKTPTPKAPMQQADTSGWKVERVQ